MKHSDDEIFNCNEDNTFEEFQHFKAERYFVSEIEKPPVEVLDINEIFKSEAKNNNENNENLLDRLNKINNISNATKTMDMTSSQAIVSHASTAILGTTVAVVSAATLGIIPNIIVDDNNKINLVTESIEDNSTINTISISGIFNNYTSDYEFFVYLNQYNNDEIINNNKANIVVDDSSSFSFTANRLFDTNKFQYDIFYLNDDNEYIIYESEIIDFKFENDYNAKLNYISPSDTKITLNDDNTYSLDIDTGFETQYPEIFKYRLEILNMDNEVIDSYTGNESNITFKIYTINSISFKYYTIGIFNLEEHIYNEEVITSSEAIVKSSLKANNDIDSINISGLILNMNLNKVYSIDIFQFKDNEIIDISSLELNIVNPNEFLISTLASYGINSYQYKIYFTDDNNNEVVLYKSDQIEYNENQEYKASLNYVSPTDSSISFNEDGTYTIDIDTGFEGDNDIFKYKIEVLDTNLEILDTYIGNDKLVSLNISSTGKIYFRYSKIGIFNSQEHVYESTILDSYTTIEAPNVTLGEKYNFNGEYFSINYKIESIYNINNMSLELQISSIEGSPFVKEINNINKEGTIILDDFKGEPKDISIVPVLTFKDEILDNNSHTIQYQEINYVMNYNLDVSVIADLTLLNSYIPLDNKNINISLDMSYILPNSYKLKITSSDNQINDTINLSEKYENTISSNAGVITIQILDQNDKSYGIEKKYTILSNDDIKGKYTAPTSTNSPNPADSVITYNTDGTINLYRYINFTCSDSNVYYDSCIYGGNNFDTPYHDLRQGKYSIIENIPLTSYIFKYYLVVKYDNVIYYISENYPSGSIDFNQEFSATSVYDSSTDKTTITIVNKSYTTLLNKVLINSIEYEMEMSENDINSIITIDGNISGDITLYGSYYNGANGNNLNDNYQSFLQYDSSISIKGNLYKEYKITINQGE